MTTSKPINRKISPLILPTAPVYANTSCHSPSSAQDTHSHSKDVPPTSPMGRKDTPLSHKDSVLSRMDMSPCRKDAPPLRKDTSRHSLSSTTDPHSHIKDVSPTSPLGRKDAPLYHKDSVLSRMDMSPCRKDTSPFSPLPKATPPCSPTTFTGLLASKRFAHKLHSRLLNRGRRPSMPTIQPKLENSYRMKPDRRFDRDMVRRIMKNVVDNRMKRVVYSGKNAGLISSGISADIRDLVKSLRYERYRVICHVTIGEVKGQGLQIASNNVWDTDLDVFVTYAYRDNDMFCVATMFAVYLE